MAGYPMKVRELAWDATGILLATGGGTAVTVWDCSGKGPEGTTPHSLERHQEPVAALAFQKAGPLLVSAGADGAVLLWHPGRSKKPLAPARLDSAVTQTAFSPDDRRVAAAGASGEVTVFDVV